MPKPPPAPHKNPSRLSMASRSGKIIYQFRVPLLLGLFIFAMEENNRHPYPLWAMVAHLWTKGHAVSADLRHLILLIPLGLYVLALITRLSATATLGGRTIWARIPVTGPLVQTGLFAHIRHPLYVGSAGMILSLSLMSSMQGAMILIGAGFPFIAFLALFEERHLMNTLPEYADYKNRVPSFFPRRSSYLRLWKDMVGPLKNGLGKSLRSEAFNVALLGGFCAYWATPRLSTFWITFLLGLGLAFAAPLWIPEQGRNSS